MITAKEVSSNKGNDSFEGFEIISNTEFRDGMVIELGTDGIYAEIKEYYINEYKTRQSNDAGRILLTELYHLPTKELMAKEIKKQLEEQHIKTKVYFSESFAELLADCLDTIAEFVNEKK